MDLEKLESLEEDEAFSELGIHAASLLESFASLDIPSWGYSLRPSIVPENEKSGRGFRYDQKNVWEVERFD